METLYETISVEVNGKKQLFDIVADSERWQGLRAYARAGTQYYELSTFERGIARADRVKRHMCGDIFAYSDLVQQSR